MPLYRWRDARSGEEVEVLRSFSEYEVPPTKEEAPGVEEPEWERKLSKGIQVTRPIGYGSKGNW